MLKNSVNMYISETMMDKKKKKIKCLYCYQNVDNILYNIILQILKYILSSDIVKKKKMLYVYYTYIFKQTMELFFDH